MNTENQSRLAIIGCGAIVESSTISALRRIGWAPRVLIDKSPRRLDVIAGKLGGPGKTVIRASNWESVSGEFDAAIVALPHALHGQIGTALLKSGKHVFMEKPLATTTADCRAMTAAARTARVNLSVGLLRRYLQIAIWTKALLDSGTLGQIKHFEAREGFVFNSDPSSDAVLRPDLAGGGVLIDTGAHTLDLLVWWLGYIAHLEYRDDSMGGVEADAVLKCELASGGTGRIELSRTRNLRNSIRVEGTDGFIEVHLYKNQVFGGSPNALAFTHESVGVADFKPQFAPDLFDSELRDFRLSVAGSERVGVSGEEATKSVELIERCYGVRLPVPIPWRTNVSVSPGISGLRPLPRLFGSSVLVTGASGFIGGRLVERLIQDHGAQVRCAIHGVGRATRLARLPVEITQIDLANSADVSRVMEGVDYVFNCAFDTRSRSQNMNGLLNLIDASAAHAVRRLVHVSTFGIYEPFQDGPLNEETRDGDRAMVYVDTKLDLEKLVLDAVREKHLPATILQPSIVYGPFCKPWTNALAEMLIYGTVVLPDNRDGLCNAVYIDDLIDGLLLAATSTQAVGERFLLSGPAPVSWPTLFEGIADALEVDGPQYWSRDQIIQTNRNIVRNIRGMLSDPRRLIKHIVNLGSVGQVVRAGIDALPPAIRAPLMNYYYSDRTSSRGQVFLPDTQTLARYCFRATVSSEKARVKLGYSPRFGFEEGMALTATYLKWAYGDVLRSLPIRCNGTSGKQGAALLADSTK